MAKECLKSGGCATACQVNPKIIYIPGKFLEEESDEIKENNKIRMGKIVLIPGEE